MTSLTEHEYKIKLQQRTSTRANITKEIKKIDPIFAAAPPDLEKAEIVLNQLGHLQEKARTLDDILLPLVSDDTLVQEIQKSDQYQSDLNSAISTIQIRLRNASLVPDVTQNRNSGNTKDVTPRLPKLEIKKYGGDPLFWDEFWDDFQSSVNERTDLPVFDKFKYLKSFLEEEALRLVDEYRLTVANYDTVVTALKERFGDPQIAIHSHFEALIALPAVTHDLSQLREIVDKCESHIRSLVALGLPETTFGVVFTPLILSKMPKFVKMEIHRKNRSQPWELKNLRAFLKEEIAVREKSERSFAGVKEKTQTSPWKQHPESKPTVIRSMKNRPSTASALASPATSSTRTLPNCVFCGNKHYSGDCRKFPDFHSHIKRIPGHCRSCLRKNHKTSECRAKRQCYHCRKEGHHQSLCAARFGSKSNETSDSLLAPTSDQYGERSATTVKPAETNLSLQTPNTKSVLQTALVHIHGNRRSALARIYFDTGGTRSFISTSMARQIGARFIGEESVSVGRFRDSRRSTLTYKIYEFDIQKPDGTAKQARMSAEATISCPIQLIPINTKTDAIFSTVKLAEPLVQKPTMVPIDILVGTDYYYDFIGQEQIRCSNGLVLLSSPFGYVVGGSLRSEDSFKKMESTLLIHQVPNMLHCMEQFWTLEVALQFFNKTIEYTNNRYQVKWPWKSDFPDLPNNYGLAVGRLKSLLNRLKPHNEILNRYNDTIVKQKELGIVEEAPSSAEGPLHYLPHHHVMSPTKSTTKLRIVYDASSKAGKDSLTLNECLHRGPVFLADAIGIILRMRLPTIALVSDIEKAFLQVGLQRADRDVTRFLWLREIDKPLTPSNLMIYRFRRVLFGVISSPFLLAATIAHHLRSSSHPLADRILDNVYVDNVFNGCENADEAIQFYKQAKKLFATASMNLREWYSNSQDVQTAIDPIDKGKGSTTSVLGLEWNLTSDQLTVSARPQDTTLQQVTKREVLRNLASVYDPCGFFSPVTITGKIIMQTLWKQKMEWDEVVPQEIFKEWTGLANDISLIPSHQISRRLPLPVHQKDTVVQLHCFTDASAKAYSAVVYARITVLNETKIALLMAKTRVAPIKHLSIPRMELMAMLIGTRLVRFVAEQLRIQLNRTIIWTDSTCVLTWVLGKPVKTVFVQNRIREICSLRDVTYRHVPTHENPADIPSRGMRFESLQSSTLWWDGPPWLIRAEVHWPTTLKEKGEDILDSAHCVVTIDEANKVGANENLPTHELLKLDRISDLRKLYRITAYIRRFIQAARKQRNPTNQSITAQELATSQMFWLRNIQSQHFQDIISGKPDSKSKLLIQQLGIVLHTDGFLRCKGRYLGTEKPEEYPILLPKHNHFSDLVIRDCHRQIFHAGIRHTLAEVRKQYWLIHGRSQIRRVLRDCRLCRYYHGGPFQIPDPPPLPGFRLLKQKPFETTGLDYMGPLLVSQKDSGSVNKVWICLFTCAAVRAVHLEVVLDQSAEQFLLCLRRFMATFGRPKLIVCDNASQFHAAERALKRVWREVFESHAVQALSAQHGFGWKFITELSPWMGGFYERMIGIVKTSLKKTIHQRCLNLVELQTLLCETASVINSRPLLYNEESIEGDCLTPAHFISRSTNHFPSSPIEDEYQPQATTGSHLILKWKRMQALLDNFWKSWQTSYLQSLQDYLWKPKTRNASQFEPNIGTVVLLKDNPIRGNWRYAKIVELIHSHDKKVRTALIRLASGRLLRRALKNLYPLEYSDESRSGSETTESNRLVKRQIPVRYAAVKAREKMTAAIHNDSSQQD